MSNTKFYFFIFLFCTYFAFSHAQNTDYPGHVQNAIDQYTQSAEKNLLEGNKAEAAANYGKLAYFLWNNQYNTNAISYFKRALELNKQVNNIKGILVIETNIGMIYSDMEKYAEALPHLEEGLKLSQNLQQKENTISALTNIALALQGLKKHEEAIAKLKIAAEKAREINNLKLLRRAYGLLYENYDALGNSDEAYAYFDLYSSLDKEIKKSEMEQVKTEAKTEINKAIEEKKQTETELVKKEELLKQTEDSLVRVEKLTREQQVQLEFNELKLGEQQMLLRLAKRKIVYATIGISLLSLFLVLISVLFIQKRRANVQIRNQRDLLERQNIDITDSISYAQNIQQAMLPDIEKITSELEIFSIFRPKDIVSGDFYWTSKITNNSKSKQELIFIALVDCTGHGVPGAFMSMIGNRLLSEIVNELKIFSPQEILELMNEKVRISLRQEETDNNDGMDMGLCCFEKSDKITKIIFCGAKRPLYIIKKGSKEMTRVKGDRKSIGGFGLQREDLKFHNQEFNIGTGDKIYMFSDGFADQNAPDRKRFGTARLEEALVQYSELPMEGQKSNLEEQLDSFQNGEEQRDDITLIGIKIL